MYSCILTFCHPFITIDAYATGLFSRNWRNSNGEQRFVEYASRVLNEAESKYVVIHKEVLAIVWGVKMFAQYLLGKKCMLDSDHRPLIALFGENKGIPTMVSSRSKEIN